LPEFDILEKRVNFKGKTGSVCLTIKLSHACAGEGIQERARRRMPWMCSAVCWKVLVTTRYIALVKISWEDRKTCEKHVMIKSKNCVDIGTRLY